MALTPQKLADLKLKEQVYERRITLVRRLMNDQQGFENVLQCFQIFPDPTKDDDEKNKAEIELANYLNIEEKDLNDLIAVMEKIKNWEDTQLNGLAPALTEDQKNTETNNITSKAAKTREEELLKTLINVLKESSTKYIGNKDKTQKDKPAQLGVPRSNGSQRLTIEQEFFNFINDQNIPKTWAEFNALRTQFIDQKKSDFPDVDLQGYFTHRESRLTEKEFLVESHTRAPGSGVRQAQVEQAQKVRAIPADYKGTRVPQAALIRQSPYTRTGYKNNSVSLLRAFNIGFTQAEVLKAMRTLKPDTKIKDIFPGHAGAVGLSEASNPTRQIMFKIFDEVYGVTAQQNAEGKIEYLCYSLKEYDKWKKLNPTAKDDEDFIKNSGKVHAMTGDYCSRQLVDKDGKPTSINYAHRSDSYNTVSEALDEQYHHFAHAADIKEVYTNMKEYEEVPDSDAAMKLNNTDGSKKPTNTNDGSAAGMTLPNGTGAGGGGGPTPPTSPNKQPPPSGVNVNVNKGDDGTPSSDSKMSIKIKH